MSFEQRSVYDNNQNKNEILLGFLTHWIKIFKNMLYIIRGAKFRRRAICMVTSSLRYKLLY